MLCIYPGSLYCAATMSNIWTKGIALRKAFSTYAYAMRCTTLKAFLHMLSTHNPYQSLSICDWPVDSSCSLSKHDCRRCLLIEKNSGTLHSIRPLFVMHLQLELARWKKFAHVWINITKDLIKSALHAYYFFFWSRLFKTFFCI